MRPTNAPARRDSLCAYVEAGSPYGRTVRGFFVWLSFGATARLN